MTRALSTLSRIVVHHSASPRRATTAEKIDQWHRDRGWDGIGYHYVVEADGEVRSGRPLDVVGAHVRGHNTPTIGVCIVGDNTSEDSQDRWDASQIVALRRLVRGIDLVLGRELIVVRHCDLAATACPGIPEALWFELLRSLRDSTGPTARTEET